MEKRREERVEREGGKGGEGRKGEREKRREERRGGERGERGRVEGREGEKEGRKTSEGGIYLKASYVTSSFLLSGSLTVTKSIALTTNPGNDAILKAHCQLRARRIKLKANARLYPM